MRAAAATGSEGSEAGGAMPPSLEGGGRARRARSPRMRAGVSVLASGAAARSRTAAGGAASSGSSVDANGANSAGMATSGSTPSASCTKRDDTPGEKSGKTGCPESAACRPAGTIGRSQGATTWRAGQQCSTLCHSRAGSAAAMASFTDTSNCGYKSSRAVCRSTLFHSQIASAAAVGDARGAAAAAAPPNAVGDASAANAFAATLLPPPPVGLAPDMADAVNTRNGSAAPWLA